MKNIPNIFFLLAILIPTNNVMAQQVSNPVQNIPVLIPATMPAPVPYPNLVDMPGTTKLNSIKITAPDVPVQSMPAGDFYGRQSTDFFDGLGRPLQTVVKKGHSDGNDIVTPHVYDNLGRESYEYLPFAAGLSSNYPSGSVKLNINTQLRGFYDQAGPDEQPYGQTSYDNSPLNRVVKQMAPGGSWVGSGTGKVFSYKTNRKFYTTTPGINPTSIFISGAFPRFTIGPGNTDIPQYQGEYDDGALYVNEMQDEDGKITQEVKDKDGLILMKRSHYLTSTSQLGISLNTFPDKYAYTIYVYDDYKRLRVVMPPEAIKASLSDITSTSNTSTYNYSWTTVNAGVITGLCYTYFYDERNRLVEKKIPGKDVEYYIYDKRDRMVMSQDGNGRNGTLPTWITTLYDALDRPVCNYIYSGGNQSRTYLQGLVNDNSTWTPTDGLYYIKNYSLYHVYPTNITGAKFLSYTYYDDYTLLPGFAFDINQFVNLTLPADGTIVPPAGSPSPLTRGLVTGSKIRVMDPDDPNADKWLSSVNYYDDRGRITQTQSQNLHHGLDISSNVYYFQGQLYKNILRHQNADAQQIPNTTDPAPITEYRLENTFVRNLAVGGGNDLVWKHTQKINTGIDYQLAYYDYDHLGRNTTKQFTAALNLNAYNMRGFLKETAYKDYGQTNIFDENLYYDKGFASKLYNGNIAGITWKGSDQQTKAYGYSYDELNRLTHAQFKQNEGTVTTPNWLSTLHDYTASNISYDLNGNIRSMNQQVTVAGASSPFAMDQLTYNYAPNSNLLTRVNDAIPTATTTAYGLPDFKDGTTANNAASAVEYNYDPDGNMTSDANKAISSITYNYLNKPDKITVAQKGTITYVYDAAGNKLQKRINPIGGTAEVWDYIGGFVYKDNVLQYILNEEGRARPVPAGTNGLPADPNSPPQNEHPTKFIYDYFTKDHLGNVRSTVTANPMTYTYLAKHEIVSANIEELVFDNIPNVRDQKPGSTDPHDGFAARLNGETPETRIGTAVMLRANPGDRFQIGVDAFYDGSRTPDQSVSANELVESLMNTLMGGQTYAGVPLSELPGNLRTVQTVLSNPALADQLTNLCQVTDNTNAPRAHLTYLWFNDQMQLDMRYSGSLQVPVNIGNWQSIGPLTIGGNGGQVGTVPGGGFPTPGYILIYIDNQSIGKDVWFDNMLVEHYTSSVTEEDHYYPYGLAVNLNQNTSVTANPYKYQSIELEKHFGLETYETLNRGLDPQLGRFNSIDPKSENGYFESPYVSMGNNPVSKTDPLGDFYTEVTANKNNTYTVVAAKADGDKNIYVTNDKGERTGQVIGKSLTDYSFLNDDGKAIKGAVINPADNSGVNFMNDKIVKPDISLVDYVLNAKGGEPLDFKRDGTTEGDANYNNPQYHYRGMPFNFGKEDGAQTFASARDIGNVAAGYVAGKVGLTWSEARLGFDALQSKQEGKITTEGAPTQSAQKVGYQVGSQVWSKIHPFQSDIKSGGFFK